MTKIRRAPRMEVDRHLVQGYENVWSDDHRRAHETLRRLRSQGRIRLGLDHQLRIWRRGEPPVMTILGCMLIGLTPQASVASMVSMANTQTSNQALTADTITDAQIEALRLESSEDGSGVTVDGDYYEAAVMLNMCDEALGTIDYGDTFTNLPMAKALELTEQRRQWSRDRCAKILNARTR